MSLAFEPHKIERDKFYPIGKHIIVSDMEFNDRISSGGIILLNDNRKNSGIRPRWGKVYAVGPKQKDVKVGQWICVAHGRWTRGIEIEDEHGRQTMRRIDPNDILMVADHQPQDDTMSDAVNVTKQTRE